MCSTFLYILPEGRHPEYSASMTDVIPLLGSVEQSNTTVCLSASSLKANVNIWRFLHQFCQSETTTYAYRVFFKVCHFLGGGSGHNTWSHFTATHATTVKWTINDHAGSIRPPHRWWFCTNCSSCGEQGVTGDSQHFNGKTPVLNNMGAYLWWWRSAHQNKYYETYS